MSFALLQRKPEATAHKAPVAVAGLHVGSSHDAHEAEAVRVSDRVAAGGKVTAWNFTRTSASSVQRMAESPAKHRARLRLQAAALKQKKSKTGPKPSITKSAPPSHAAPKSAIPSAPAPEHATHAPEPAAHAAPAVSAHGGASHPVLNSPGAPLDAETRRTMELSLGCDLGAVRIHTDPAAADSAKALHARAYTVGHHITFAQGRYAPNSTEGRKLLAHELTHVVQQDPALAHKPGAPAHAKHSIQRDSDDDDDAPSLWHHPIKWAEYKIRRMHLYKIVCMFIGHDIIDDEPVNADAADIIEEMVKALGDWIPGARDIADKIIESKVIREAYNWIKNELNRWGISWSYYKGLLEEAWDSVHARDIVHPIEAFDRIKEIFQPGWDKIVGFAGALASKVWEVIVDAVMNRLGGAKVMQILRKAGGTLMDIVRHPVQFVGNLIKAIGMGFTNFASNIGTHLQNSLMEFLFGSLNVKISLPVKFSITGIFNLILDILDLHYSAFRARMVAKTSEETVTFLEGTYDFVMKIAHAKSLSAAWNVIQQQAEDMIDQVVDTAVSAIKEWVITKIVKAAVEKVLELFTPASAFIAAIEAIYHTIKTLIDKGKQLLAIVEAVGNSLSLIVAGNLDQAAKFVEDGLAKTLSFIIAFLAEQAGISDIADTIRGFIKKVHDKVLAIFDKIVDFVVGKTKNLWERSKATAGKILDWWHQRKEVLIGDEEHAVYMEGTEEEPHLMIASTPTPWAKYLADMKVSKDKQKLKNDTIKLVANLEKPFNSKTSAGENSAQVNEKRDLFTQVCANIVKLGFPREAPPQSEIKFGGLGTDDRGTKATASILSSLHEPGSQPSDKAPIWTNLGSLIGKKNYVQGHLLNHNLGGPGVRENLTPINKRANSQHLHRIETDIKRAVMKERKVMYYQVEAIYGAHPAKPKKMIRLEETEAKVGLTAKQQTQLDEYKAEQKLTRGFKFTAYELQHTIDGKWTADKDVTKITGKIPHDLDLTQ